MECQKDHETITTKLMIKEKPAYIKLVWKTDENTIFSIQVFYEDHSWIGSFTRAAFDKYRGRLKVTNDEYIRDIKKCLSEESPMYKYDFVICPSSQNENSATFSWKKLFEGSSAVIIYGSVELQESIDTKSSLIDSLLQENRLLKNTLEICRDENYKANCELEKYKSELDNIITMQSSMEDTLYSKFAQLLNTKKRRIQVLEDALNNIKDI